MIIRVHSFSIPVNVDSTLITGFTWNVALGRIEISIEGGDKPLPVDEEMWELENKYTDAKGDR